MVGLAIRRPIAVTMAYLAVALLGVAAWRNIPIELLPDTSLPQLFVRAYISGASPEVTEALLTAPLEAAIQQVRGVEKIESQSYESYGRGVAEITVHFARGTDMDFARLELSERLAALESDLPANATTPIIEPYIPDEFAEQNRPFLRYTVTGPYTLEALRAHVDEVIEPEISQIDGVGYVQVLGGRQRLIEIELDEEKIHALRLEPFDVLRRISELEYVRQAGVIESRGMLRSIAIRHRAESASEIANLPILIPGGEPIRIRDVARIHDTYEDPQNYYRIDGFPALSFTVYKEAGTNTVAVADRVKQRLLAMQDRIDGLRAELEEARRGARRGIFGRKRD